MATASDETHRELDKQIKRVDAYLNGDRSKENEAAVQDATHYRWPEIQKRLIEIGAAEAGYNGDPYEPFYTTESKGKRAYYASPDAWWLKHFQREDVVLELPGVVIMNTQPWHVRSVCISLWEHHGIAGQVQPRRRGAQQTAESPPASVYRESFGAYARVMEEMPVGSTLTNLGFSSTSTDPGMAAMFSGSRVRRDDLQILCFDERDIMAQIERFADGQFAAQRISGPHAGHCVGMATTMRTSRPPTAPFLPWNKAIGDLSLRNHESDGAWLYSVEQAVHPYYREHDISTGLIRAIIGLVKRLNLRGWYKVDSLTGYRRPALAVLAPAHLKAVAARVAAIENDSSNSDKDAAMRALISELPTYADLMDVVEYGNRVIAGEIADEGIAENIELGFRVERLIADDAELVAAGQAGIMLVWDNSEYYER
ncbi:MAG: hypothetical protein OXG23_12980 [Chloroflexi bacterium]|nr:hypothetical protein [Chloroflexota bacterium]